MKTLVLSLVCAFLIRKAVWGLLCAFFICETVLLLFNQYSIRKNFNRNCFRDFMDDTAFQKSMRYALTNNVFALVQLFYQVLIWMLILHNNLIAWYFWQLPETASLWIQSIQLFLWSVLLNLPLLPLEYFRTFKIESAFGFNRSTIALWITDHLKNILVGACIQIPLIALLFYVLQTFPHTWWGLGTIGMVILQIIGLWLYPKLILPLFNKLTPLDEGPLKTRLTLLAQKAGFSSAAIQILDSSKRSTHSNAYCSSFGKIQHIVLYDTLLQDCTDAEIEAIVAHEIGHYKRRHLIKLLMLYALLTLGILKGCDTVLHSDLLAQAFAIPTMTPLLLLTILVTFSELLTYWFKPIFNRFSRRYEYEADAFAGQQSPTSATDLIQALKKLCRANASNLFPHPLYSAFHCSHPTLLERERALERRSRAA